MTPTLTSLKKSFGTAKTVDLTAVRFLAWDDAFEVDFENGLTFPAPHSTIRKQNKNSTKAEVEKVELEDWCQWRKFRGHSFANCRRANEK